MLTSICVQAPGYVVTVLLQAEITPKLNQLQKLNCLPTGKSVYKKLQTFSQNLPCFFFSVFFFQKLFSLLCSLGSKNNIG